ncbi:MAG: porin [Alistipes sp.]|nr:porin [Alistipes sp.]
MMKTFTKILCAALALLSVSSLFAQQGYEKSNEIFRLGVETRFDYLNQALDGEQLYGASGFKVRYFNLRMDGQITPKFTYSWRQRFNNINSAADFVNNTDWLHLTYKPNQNWAISAGKQVVMIGGWEYDRAPIDVYYCSEYWNNVNCFQLGASVAFTTNKGDDTITFQVCQSPYDKMAMNYAENPDPDGDPIKLGDLYAYNLYWMGSHGFYTALHSLNFSEYERGKFDVYVVLGNQFKFGDATIQLDLMNRGVSAKELLFENFSIMGEVDYLIAKRVNIFAKATYDKVGANYPTVIDDEGDYVGGLFLCPGTEMTRVGGGVEYYPLGGRGNRDIRLHAAYCYNIGNNTNTNGTAFDKGSFLTVGLTWKIDVIEGISALIDKRQAKRAANM